MNTFYEPLIKSCQDSVDNSMLFEPLINMTRFRRVMLTRDYDEIVKYIAHCFKDDYKISKCDDGTILYYKYNSTSKQWDNISWTNVGYAILSSCLFPSLTSYSNIMIQCKNSNIREGNRADCIEMAKCIKSMTESRSARNSIVTHVGSLLSNI